MRRKFSSILLLLPVAARAWPQSAAIPDTPAGHTFQAWLDAFNGGDRARIQEYISKYRVAPIPFLAIALTIRH